MFRFYKTRLGFFWILLGILLVGSQVLYAQCPNTALTVSPTTTSICSGSTVQVTIGLAETNIAYQLRNNVTDAPLSGYYLGAGANLLINSDALAADVAIKVYAINPLSFCAVYLTNLVTVTVNQPPTVAVAGSDQTACLSATLAGNAPVVGTGQWTVVSGLGGSFALNTDPTTLFSGTAGNTYVLQWTISNGVCTPSSDQVTIKLDADPAPVADAGTAQVLCATSTTLAANAATTGIGTWTVISGAGGSFVNVNSPTTVFNGVTGTVYDLRWTISNGVCPSTSDNVTITFNTPPT
ncbi:MAG TPA: hypothetical protein VE467_11875, partial [Chryseolinea sp.]|nr:hypothetical protein [Chryseolinea sp.]